MSQTRMSAAEYRHLVEEAGGSPRKVRLPDCAQTQAAGWPTMALGVAPDEPRLRRLLMSDSGGRQPIARAVAVPPASRRPGFVSLLTGVSDVGEIRGATCDDGRWQMMTAWTPQEARILAGQLLLAAAECEKGER